MTQQKEYDKEIIALAKERLNSVALALMNEAHFSSIVWGYRTCESELLPQLTAALERVKELESKLQQIREFPFIVVEKSEIIKILDAK